MSILASFLKDQNIIALLKNSSRAQQGSIARSITILSLAVALGSYAVHTVVSGRYVREVFLNNDFNFEAALGKTFDLWLLTDSTNQDLINTPKLRSLITKNLAVDVKQYTPRVVEHLIIAAHEMLGDIEGSKEIPHLYPLMQHMVAIAGASIFVGPKLAKNKDLVETFKNLAIDIGKYGKAINKHRKHLYHALSPEIDERLAKMEKGGDWERPQDLLQSVIETLQLTSNHPHRYMLPVQYFLALVFASIHTTSENATITMYRLLQHPEAIEPLLEEQQQVLEKHYGPNFDDSDMTKLFTGEVVKDFTRLDSLCRETMRVRNFYLELPHTYLGKSRFTMSNGAVIHPGDDVIINAYTNHTNPEIQCDGVGDYHEFKPFRFVEKGRQATRVGDDFLFFGQGQHACP
ncbi:predicted protein [Lichtheimia corymbifera JMRC:FSU:9682]|uniref:Cytochrome p450 n=1 Tax=Lichtheimia corymbifera JMRC:FSU:9682 TaxID=1263082 RepID=A0A068S9Q0_9FUNG|nr:predicted protein [Lichtheimia corymbifera JMRC:FSU:9682]